MIIARFIIKGMYQERKLKLEVSNAILNDLSK